ncbi:putative pentatricopeptide repeat-containing protein At1g16830 [Mangifera indica]|uniref:putative pentatricopeptide repeat-containing protein At1g16830 n=1 Tax=Mangifera indica TaxID=29780 RepID=UPI001CF96830|nr:putative pentatricopeptide repeat-containing protein At1g16830 [Mangifera indica]XP_044466848.1 putative pentatricopeptide repeat-containing protein At1g16830 [Mangifera indica]XP_044466849.1 putative pentatricopeptide repeat-containing protein At1g16830 [Mangifera indica]XP_044466850.1 putative pentatricopeptide repeat-containing protein At1g16830 [Mangifera indica]XP_044466851.1 putative pentatricopeptide repeat-containing protein At1g16830 [Mangifera indica]XP_044466852.1 putative pentat
MLWRYRSLLHIVQQRKFWNTLSFKSIHHICATTHHVPNNYDRDEYFHNKRKPIILTAPMIYSTLLNCPSDLIALCFFLWCAKQRNYFHDSQSIGHMISVVARLTEQYKTVRGLVIELVNIGCVIKAQTFMLLLRIYWRGGLHERVFEAFEEMRRFGYMPNTFAHNVIMDVLFKVGHVELGIKILKETKVPNFLSFNIALCNLCKTNDSDTLRDVIRIMLRKGFYPNVHTFEMILNFFCKKGRMVEAYQVLGLVLTLGTSLSVNVWSALIDGFCRLSKLDIAGYLLGKMVETGCTPNVVTYTSLIKGFMESKMVDNAFGILNTMELEGQAPDLVFYNVLIDCLSKNGRYDDALSLFHSLSQRKLVPDCYTFSSLLSTLCLSKRFSLLPKLVNGLVVEADLVVCNALLSYFCEAGLPSLAVELYNDMVGRGLRPDRYSFVGLLCGLCGDGRIDEAVSVYQGIVMTQNALDAHVHTVIIDKLIKAGKCHRAIRLFRRAIVEKYPLDVVSYAVAICGLLKGGRIGDASTLYGQMKEVGLSPNAYIYNMMLSNFCREKDIKMVKQLLQEIIEARIHLNYRTFMRVSFLRHALRKRDDSDDILMQKLIEL